VAAATTAGFLQVEKAGAEVVTPAAVVQRMAARRMEAAPVMAEGLQLAV
jgi:hypothetical protein